MKKYIGIAVLLGAVLLLPAALYALGSVEDSFDSFNGAGWQTFGGSAKNFEFEDGASGNCFLGGCAAGNSLGSTIPRMYLQSGVGRISGSFTVYARAKSGSLGNPSPVISLCAATAAACGNRINFTGQIPPDGIWHQYFVSWRSGATNVETCFLQDSTDPTACVWSGAALPAGAPVNGVALWSSNGYRSDLGANLWFDELSADPSVVLRSSASALTNAPIPVEAIFSQDVIGLDIADILAENGVPGALVAASGSEYSFTVIPAADGTVTLRIPAGTAEDTEGNPNTASESLMRVYDGTPPALAIVSGPEEGSTAGESAATFMFVSDAPATCSFDGEPFVFCADSYATTTLGSGAHAFVVTATDEAGNTATLTRNWNIVFPPPQPTDKDQCKKDGWELFINFLSFKNQGDCVSFVTHLNKDKDDKKGKDKKEKGKKHENDDDDEEDEGEGD